MSEESRIKQKPRLKILFYLFKYFIQRTLPSCILDTLFDITQFIVSQKGKLRNMDSRGYIYCKEKTKLKGNEESNIKIISRLKSILFQGS